MSFIHLCLFFSAHNFSDYHYSQNIFQQLLFVCFILSPITEHEDGSPKVESPDAVPNEVIIKLDFRQHEGKSMYQSIAIIKCGLVPDGFISSPWRPNVTKETLLDMLRTIVATYRFRNEVANLKQLESTSPSTHMFRRSTRPPARHTMRGRTTTTCSSA